MSRSGIVVVSFFIDRKTVGFCFSVALDPGKQHNPSIRTTSPSILALLDMKSLLTLLILGVSDRNRIELWDWRLM
jgi:hypothetical protein